MSFKRILISAALLCAVHPCFAQQQSTTHHHKVVSKHKHSAHPIKHTHTSSHKHHSVSVAPKHATEISSQQGDQTLNSTKLAAATNAPIPQPQFDTRFAVDTTQTNWQSIPANSTTTDNTTDANSAIDTSQEALTALAYKTVETKRYSAYKFGGTVFDPSAGIYKIDCSAYINDLLSQANPEAFSSLTTHTQTAKPTSHDYYNFFKRLPDEPTQYWQKVNAVNELKPGGILVFLSQYIHRRHLYSGGGHVMLVMSKPIPTSSADTFQVKVADSASSGHSDDTRLPHRSGIGIGTLLLKVDPFTGQPKAYAWRLDDHWRSHTLFAMAQPTSSI